MVFLLFFFKVGGICRGYFSCFFVCMRNWCSWGVLFFFFHSSLFEGRFFFYGILFFFLQLVLTFKIFFFIFNFIFSKFVLNEKQKESIVNSTDKKIFLLQKSIYQAKEISIKKKKWTGRKRNREESVVQSGFSFGLIINSLIRENTRLKSETLKIINLYFCGKKLI